MAVAVPVGFLGYLGWVMADRWSEVRSVVGALSPLALALAGLAAALASWCGFRAWRVILVDLGAELPTTAALRVFYLGQLTKYLPGKVWPIVAQARLGRAYRVPQRASAAAALLVMLVSLGTGLVLTMVLLPLLGHQAFERARWTVLVLPLALAACWPPLLNRGIARLLRWAGREPLPRPLTRRGVGRAVGWSLTAWLAYGVHLWLLLADLDAAGAGVSRSGVAGTGFSLAELVELLLRSVGAFAGSWAIGFLLAVAPAGVGPREVALPLLLDGAVSQPVALVAAVVSRLLLTIVDLVAPGVAVLAERVRRRAATRDVPGATRQV